MIDFFTRYFTLAILNSLNGSDLALFILKFFSIRRIAQDMKMNDQAIVISRTTSMSLKISEQYGVSLEVIRSSYLIIDFTFIPYACKSLQWKFTIGFEKFTVCWGGGL